MTYTKHIDVTTKKARPTINVLKALAGTDWGKDKETLANTYKIYTRPILEYANPAWCPIVSNKQMQRLQTIQNTALRLSTGHTKDTNVQHLHDETYTLPLKVHTKMLASQFREKAMDPTHPLHEATLQPPPPRLKKQTVFNSDYTLKVQRCDRGNPDLTMKDISRNIKTIHTETVRQYLRDRPVNSLLNAPALKIHASEKNLTRKQRRTLAQLRANKSPLLESYLHKLDSMNHPTPTCLLCNRHDHDTKHLFTCTELRTALTVEDLWNRPVEVAELVEEWEDRLAGRRAPN